MADLTLRQRLSVTGVANNIALRGVVDTEFEPVVAISIYWRWEDEPDMESVFLADGVAGHDIFVPFDLKGRSIRLFLIGKTETGEPTDRQIIEAEQFVYAPLPPPDAAEDLFEASEDLDALDFVNIHNVAGVGKVRKADATDNTRVAHGFVVESADAFGESKVEFVTGDFVRVFFPGNKLSGLTGLTPGAPLYLSETAGQATHTSPSGSAKMSQILGYAISDTAMMFDPQEPVEQT